MKRQDDRIRKAVREPVEVVPYDPRWPEMFRLEREHLRRCLPADLVGRIEHFGSTAVPGLAAKPVIDMLVEVADLEAARSRIVPVLESQGYEYFWRPIGSEVKPPFYAWFIKRGPAGERTHHVHMVEPESRLWRRLWFRDYLRDHPEVAAEYGELKMELAREHRRDRVAYTEAKTEFIARIMDRITDG